MLKPRILGWSTVMESFPLAGIPPPHSHQMGPLAAFINLFNWAVWVTEQCATPGGEDPAQGAAVNKWQQTGLPKLKHIILQRTGHTPGTALPTVLHVDYKGDWLPLSVCSIAQQNLPAMVKGSETRCQGAHWCSWAEVIHHSVTGGNGTVSLGPLPVITRWGNPAGWGPCGGIFL